MKITYLVMLMLLACCSAAHGLEVERIRVPDRIRQISPIKTGKALEAKDVPVRVKDVQFTEVEYNGETHLAAGVVFTKSIEAATVQPNVNIRLLKEQNGFWVDVSTQNNVVRIMPKHISWLSGAPLESGSYRMHLRGTIRDTDGLYLDCNNDGVGERGNLPAYDSPIHSVEIRNLEESGLLPLIQN